MLVNEIIVLVLVKAVIYLQLVSTMYTFTLVVVKMAPFAFMM